MGVICADRPFPGLGFLSPEARIPLAPPFSPHLSTPGTRISFVSPSGPRLLKQGGPAACFGSFPRSAAVSAAPLSSAGGSLVQNETRKPVSAFGHVLLRLWSHLCAWLIADLKHYSNLPKSRKVIHETGQTNLSFVCYCA